MALVLADRVKESCTSPGTGTVTLLGAATEYQSFSAGVGANNTTYYTIADQAGSNWEVGLGTVGSGGTTLARTTVLSSSNSGSLVNFSSGTQDVWVDYPASKAVHSSNNPGTSGQVLTSGGTGVAPTWAAVTPTGSTYTRTSFTATAGQTTFTVTYTVGYIEVFLNGVLLNGTDYTATSGTSVVLSVAAALNDIVETIAYNTTSVGTASTATNLAGGIASQIPYQTGAGATSFIANGTSGQVLTSAGTSTPTWATPIALSGTNTWTGTQSFTGSSSVLATVLTNAAETTTVSATAATGTIAYYPSTQSVLYYTTNASANWTTNLTFSSGTTLNTAMTTGQSLTVAFLVTQGSTAYYNTVVQVDGTTSGVTTIWQGGAPTKGNASGVDVYTYTIIKTGSATFTVLATQTQFK